MGGIATASLVTAERCGCIEQETAEECIEYTAVADVTVVIGYVTGKFAFAVVRRMDEMEDDHRKLNPIYLPK